MKSSLYLLVLVSILLVTPKIVNASQDADFANNLRKIVVGVDEANSSSGFSAWLDTIDPISRTSRRAVLQSLAGQYDVRGVASIFLEYYQDAYFKGISAIGDIKTKYEKELEAIRNQNNSLLTTINTLSGEKNDLQIRVNDLLSNPGKQKETIKFKDNVISDMEQENNILFLIIAGLVVILIVVLTTKYRVYLRLIKVLFHCQHIIIKLSFGAIKNLTSHLLRPLFTCWRPLFFAACFALIALGGSEFFRVHLSSRELAYEKIPMYRDSISSKINHHFKFGMISLTCGAGMAGFLLYRMKSSE